MLDASLLAEVELFGTLPAEAVERVAAAAQPRSLRRGDVLFREGDDGEELFVVESGRIAISNKSFDGRESVFALMEAGLLDELRLWVHPFFVGHGGPGDLLYRDTRLTHFDLVDTKPLKNGIVILTYHTR